MTNREYDGRGERQDTMQSRTEEAKAKASEMTSRAQEEADARREQAAGGIQSAAETVRDRSQEQGGTAGQVGMQVADNMENAAGYLQTHTTSEMWSDVEDFARKHPGQAVAGAVVAGLIIGRILR